MDGVARAVAAALSAKTLDAAPARGRGGANCAPGIIIDDVLWTGETAAPMPPSTRSSRTYATAGTRAPLRSARAPRAPDALFPRAHTSTTVTPGKW
jgi:hypothetical protein